MKNYEVTLLTEYYVGTNYCDNKGLNNPVTNSRNRFIEPMTRPITAIHPPPPKRSDPVILAANY